MEQRNQTLLTRVSAIPEIPKDLPPIIGYKNSNLLSLQDSVKDLQIEGLLLSANIAKEMIRNKIHEN